MRISVCFSGYAPEHYWALGFTSVRSRNMSERSTAARSGGAEGRGATNISDTVVQKIAGIAAQEVEKVQMGGGAAAAVGGFLTSVTGAVTGGNSTGGGAGLTSGVSV